MNLPKIIKTKRLLLLQLDLDFLELSLMDEKKAHGAAHFKVSSEWFQEKALIAMRIAQMKEAPHLSSWLLRAIIRRSNNQMVGHFNAHGKPGMPHLKPYCDDGAEIGYTIYESERRKGYASEAILGFAEAIPKPATLILSIGEKNEPSLQLAKKLGYTQIDQVVDEGETELVFKKHFV